MIKPHSVTLEKWAEVKPRILFTGGGGAGTEGLARMLSGRYEVFFADADEDAKPYSITQDHWFKIPMASSSVFADEITDLCRQQSIDLLIPTVDEELLSIARLAAPPNLERLVPPEHFVVRHLDKLVSNQFLLDADLPAPFTVSASDGRLSFPCIIKPRSGRGSRNVAIVSCEEELQAQITMARQKPSDFVVQELVAGQEYTVMMAADRGGELRAIVPVLVERKRGITLRAITKHDHDVIEACRLIHEADPVPGCYNIQLIKTVDGSVKPFEINPRISTTACLGLAAGVDFIGIFLGLPGALGRHDQGLIGFTERLGLRRSWYNEIVEPSSD